MSASCILLLNHLPRLCVVCSNMLYNNVIYCFCLFIYACFDNIHNEMSLWCTEKTIGSK